MEYIGLGTYREDLHEFARWKDPTQSGYYNNLKNRVGRYLLFCLILRRDPTVSDADLLDTYLDQLRKRNGERLHPATADSWLTRYVGYWHQWCRDFRGRSS